MKHNPNHPVALTEHHMYPKSRFPHLRNNKQNIKLVKRFIHLAFHRLFSNLSPPEIVRYMKSQEFTATLNNPCRYADFKIVFGNADITQAIEIVESEWTPNISPALPN